ncbi:Retinol dehydrogenase 13 [Hypsibius exemplaris]|uniref:Retinol dehydrogenase 13 n=1 Tax=Hypsibius exemplaris TaxID=2072580 RepID=A0A9X6NBV6_HYPEX|nr:Retinol dehydrogenase 13 [Hypsibius exemplaris]
MSGRFLTACAVVGGSVAATLLYKEVIQGCRFDKIENLEGKVAVITGANTGIGKETAKEFAKRGAKVILACRDLERCKAARKEIFLAARMFGAKDPRTRKRKPAVVCELLDLASFDSIRAFVQRMEKEDRLDYLINNAGTMRDPTRVLTKDGLEKQMGVNHFGHFLLTNLLLAKLQKSSPSRIVVLSSTAHQRGDLDFSNLNWDHDYDPGNAYNASKLANLLFVQELANKLQGSAVTVNAVHPGLVYTDLFRHLPAADSVTRFILGPFMWMFFKSPRAGAQTTMYVALSEDLEGVSGKYFSNCTETAPADKALDRQLAQRLWTVSEKWTRLNS